MSVRFSGSAGGYTSTAGLPTVASFTITCWVYYVSNPGFGTTTIWSLDSSTSQYAYMGSTGNGPYQWIFDWNGSGSTHALGPTLTTGVWYKTAVAVNGTSAYLDIAPAGSSLSTYSGAANFALPTGTLKLWIGESAFGVGSNYRPVARVANFKMWDATLGVVEVEQELQSYLPQRTASLNRWYPWISTDTADMSGYGRTLSGGGAASTETGPPISWSRPRISVIPWDPATTVWYVLYDTISGELISSGTIDPSPAPADTAILALLGAPPNQAIYEWSTTARAYVLREGDTLVDRISDLLADASLAAAWASLTAPESAAMQARIAQMLGPYRYRQSFQDVDLT